MPDYTHATATKDGKCANCQVPILTGQDFTWDNTNKTYDAKGKRICLDCYQNKIANEGKVSEAISKPIVAPIRSNVGEQFTEWEINAIEDKLAALQNIIDQCIHDKFTKLEDALTSHWNQIQKLTEQGNAIKKQLKEIEDRLE